MQKYIPIYIFSPVLSRYFCNFTLTSYLGKVWRWKEVSHVCSSFLDWITSVGSSRSFLLFKKWRHSILKEEEEVRNGGEERKLLENPTTTLNQSSTCRMYVPQLEKGPSSFLLQRPYCIFFFFFSRGLNIASNLFSCLFGQHMEYHHQRHGNKKNSCLCTML